MHADLIKIVEGLCDPENAELADAALSALKQKGAPPAELVHMLLAGELIYTLRRIRECLHGLGASVDSIQEWGIHTSKGV